MKLSILLQFTLLQVCIIIGTYGDEKFHTKNLQVRSKEKDSHHPLLVRHKPAAYDHQSIETKHDASHGVHEPVLNRHGVHKPAHSRHGDHKTVHSRHGERHHVEHKNRAKQSILFHTQNRNHDGKGYPSDQWNISGSGNEDSGSESDTKHGFYPGGPIVTVNPIENPGDDNNGNSCDLNIVKILQELLEAVRNSGSDSLLGGNEPLNFFEASGLISGIQQAVQHFEPASNVNNANGEDGQGESGGGELSVSNGSSGGAGTAGGGNSETTGTESTDETTVRGVSQGGNGVGEGTASAGDVGDGAEGTGGKGGNTTGESRSVTNVKANNRNVHSKHFEGRSKNKHHEDRFKTKHHEERVHNKHHEYRYRGHNKHHEEKSKNKYRDERSNNMHHEARTHNKHHEERSKGKYHEERTVNKYHEDRSKSEHHGG